jgi:hypothetical protein
MWKISGVLPFNPRSGKVRAIGSFKIGTGVETRRSGEFGPSASKINS